VVSRRDWFSAATARLVEAGCEDAVFDARCLLEDFGGMPRGHAADDTPLTAEQETLLSNALAQRVAGRPLQYILGEWEFLNLTLKVGEGVLIPRPDTELLCEIAAEYLRDITAPRVLDLCAGSGCVGLGVASLHPDALVTEVELSDAAMGYLKQNVLRYPDYAVTVRQADVLTDWGEFADGWDGILSNPPYIPTAHLDGLMREVQREPRMALDGDVDGLRFYRVIAEQWCKKLRVGGFCAVEVGFDQGQTVAALFREAGLREVEIHRDLAGVERVVLGVR
jgi:release factor glutamine methyltransferase